MSGIIKHIQRSLWCLLLLNSGFAAAQQTKSFYVVNAGTKMPVQEAQVQSADGAFNTPADENGLVNLSAITDTSAILLISCIGFETAAVAIAQLPAHAEAIVYLTPKIPSLAEVKVIATTSGGIFKTISDLDIHLRPISNSQEVLRMVPGLFIGQHAGGGKAEQIFLRGFDLDHGTDINLTVDGMPANMVSHAHGQGYADLHFLIPELIEKVSFNKGPYFADKGNFTTAGFVAFKTKDFLENNFIRVEGGQFHSFRAVTGINLLKPNNERRTQSLYFAGEASFTNGYFDNPQDFSRFNGTLKYHGCISDQTTLTTTFTSFASQWNASGQIPERAVKSGLTPFFGAIDNTEGGKTARHNANVEVVTNFKNGGRVRNQLFYNRYRFELYSNFTYFKADPVNGDQIRQKEERNMYGYNGTYHHTFHLGKFKTETKAGIQIRYDDINNIELTRTKSRTINTAAIRNGDVNELNGGGYWSQRMTLAEKLEVTGGLRIDYFNNRYKDALAGRAYAAHALIINPKLQIHYTLSNKVQLYVYNGKGFHSNDTRVAVQQYGRKVLPPAYGTDLGSIFKVSKKMIVQAALWHLWLDQEFVYVGDEGVVEAGGQTSRMGIDLSVRYEVVRNLYADADVSIANPKALNVDKKESALPLAPLFTSVGGLSYRTAKGWNGSLRYRYMADRPANERNTVTAKGYCIADAAVNFTRQKWEAGIAVQNLLNSRWKETQFDTESRLQNEPLPVSEIHFTPGTPFFARASITLFF